MEQNVTDSDWRKRERRVERLKKENADLLTGFRAWLVAKGLTSKTVGRHVDNLEFYIDSFLAETEETAAREGADRVSYFLGYWFIRKALWAGESSIRQMAAGLKKFYVYLETEGLVGTEDVQDLKDAIKEGMPEWVATCERYDDPDIEDPSEIWGL